MTSCENGRNDEAYRDNYPVVHSFIFHTFQVLKENFKIMKPGKIISFILVAILVSPSFLSCRSGDEGKQGRTPNVVLIISDDQSWTDYSFMGHPHIETPHIDRLAREGLTFTRGYVTAPLCRPSLASIVSGLYPRQHKILGNDPVFSYQGEQKWGENG